MTRRAHARAERLYACFLALYPRWFRREYGDELRQVFRDLLDDPAVPRWRLWFAVLADIPGSVLPEHIADAMGGSEMEGLHWSRNVSIRRGAAIGLVLGTVWTVYNVTNNALILDTTGYAVQNNGLTAAFVLLSVVAGFVGARRAGTVRGGAFAGFTAALVGNIIGITTLWLVTWLFFPQVRVNPGMLHDFQHSGATNLDAFIIQDAFGATAFGFPLAMLLGTLLSTLGGMVAKATLRLRTR